MLENTLKPFLISPLSYKLSQVIFLQLKTPHLSTNGTACFNKSKSKNHMQIIWKNCFWVISMHQCIKKKEFHFVKKTVKDQSKCSNKIFRTIWMISIPSANHLSKRRDPIKMTNFIIENRKTKNKKNKDKDKDKKNKGRDSTKKEMHRFGRRRNLSPRNRLNLKIIHIVILHLWVIIRVV